MTSLTQQCVTRNLSTRVKRQTFTPLGQLYYKESLLWQRIKIETELMEELGVKRHSLRAYMVSTPAFRMPSDMKAIILRTLPEAKKCFKGAARLRKPATI